MKKILLSLGLILALVSPTFAQGGFVSPDQVMPNSPSGISQVLFKNIPFPGLASTHSTSGTVTTNGFIGMGNNNYIAYMMVVKNETYIQFIALKMVGGKIIQKGLPIRTANLSGIAWAEPTMVSLSSTTAVFAYLNVGTHVSASCLTLNTSTLGLTLSTAVTSTEYPNGMYVNLLRYSDTKAIMAHYTNNSNQVGYRYINTSGSTISSISTTSVYTFGAVNGGLKIGWSTGVNFTTVGMVSGTPYVLTTYPNGSSFTHSAVSTVYLAGTGNYIACLFYPNKDKICLVSNTNMSTNSLYIAETTNPGPGYTYQSGSNNALYAGNSGSYQKISHVLDDTYAVMIGVTSSNGLNITASYLLSADNIIPTENSQLNNSIIMHDIRLLQTNPLGIYISGGTSQAEKVYSPFLGCYTSMAGNYALHGLEHKNYFYYDSNEKILYFGAPWCWNGNQESTKNESASFMIVPIKVEIDEAGARFGVLNLK